MNKWKSIVLVLLLVLMVFSLDQPLFGQQRPLQQLQKLEQQLNTGQQQQKTGQQQQPILPGLYIPKPAPLAAKHLEMMQPKPKQLRKRVATQPMKPVSQETKTQYFIAAMKTTMYPSALPDFINSFTFSVSNLYIPGKGGVIDIEGCVNLFWDIPYQNGKPGDYDPGYVSFDVATVHDEGKVRIAFFAKKGVYFVIIDTLYPQNLVAFVNLKYPPEGQNNPNYQGYQGNTFVVNGQSAQSDPQSPAVISFPICMLQDGEVDLTLFMTGDYPYDFGTFRSCEVIPQHF